MILNKEQNNRNKLKEKKPLAYEKAIKYKDNPRPIIQNQADYRCNAFCEHCSVSPLMQNKNNRKQLSIEDIRNVYSQADKLGFFRTTISGGEPTIFPHLKEIIEAIDSTKWYIQMDSNCINFTEKLAWNLKEWGVDRLQPSLDSLIEEEHNSFRHSKTAYKKVLESVNICQKVGLDLFMQTCVDKPRLHSQEFIDYLKFFNNKGISVFVSFFKPVGNGQDKLDNLITRDDLKYMEELEKEYNVFTHLSPGYNFNLERHCVAGRNIISLTAFGDILICPYWYCSMGNIYDEFFEDIFKRLQKVNIFRKDTCLLAEDREFIDKYLVKSVYNKDLPIHYSEILTDEDFD
jgi:MoaA/NifB/PqqE/SkfB family radical SAM enzyme